VAGVAAAIALVILGGAAAVCLKLRRRRRQQQRRFISGPLRLAGENPFLDPRGGAPSTPASASAAPLMSEARVARPRHEGPFADAGSGRSGASSPSRYSARRGSASSAEEAPEEPREIRAPVPRPFIDTTSLPGAGAPPPPIQPRSPLRTPPPSARASMYELAAGSGSGSGSGSALSHAVLGAGSGQAPSAWRAGAGASESRESVDSQEDAPGARGLARKYSGRRTVLDVRPRSGVQRSSWADGPSSTESGA
jgi:hypothetical protein